MEHLSRFFDKSDIHIDLPSGAIPKDAPSVAVTVATALLSILIKKPIRQGIAMTGELTWRGRVLPVAGIKEKILAAYRLRFCHVAIKRILMNYPKRYVRI